MASKREAWLSFLRADPRPALLASDEPFARFVTLTAVLGSSKEDAEVRGARQAVVVDPRVRALVERLPAWDSGFVFSGHNSPGFPPNIPERPKQLASAARTLLGAWRNRTKEKPYMFGHGQRFVDGKWPPTWYDASAVLDALAPYPSVWKGKAGSADDRKSTAEIVQALAATFGADGMVTPRSCYKSFEDYSFDQKKRPSPWATARLCGLLRVFSAVAGTMGGDS